MSNVRPEDIFAIRELEDGIQFEVQVVPRASRVRIGPVVGGRLKVQLTAAPVDGAANQALQTALAEALAVGRSQVHIVRGETSRKKTVRIFGGTKASLFAAMGVQK